MADSPIQMLETPRSVRLPVDSMATLVTSGERVEAGCLVAESSSNARWYQCSHAPLLSTVSANGHSPNGHSSKGTSSSRFEAARYLELLV